MADKHQYGFENGVTITPEEAWQVYAGIEKPTYIGCATLLVEQGHKVSYQTLHKWGKRFDWPHRIALARATQTMDPASKDIFSILKLKAEWMAPGHVAGPAGLDRRAHGHRDRASTDRHHGGH